MTEMKDAVLAYVRNINTQPGPNAGRSIDPTKPGPTADRIAWLERYRQRLLHTPCAGEAAEERISQLIMSIDAELYRLREQPKEGDAAAYAEPNYPPQADVARQNATSPGPQDVRVTDAMVLEACCAFWQDGERDIYTATDKANMRRALEAALAQSDAQPVDRYYDGYSDGQRDADRDARHERSRDWMNALLMLVHYSDMPQHLRRDDYEIRLKRCWDDARRLSNSKPGDVSDAQPVGWPRLDKELALLLDTRTPNDAAEAAAQRIRDGFKATTTPPALPEGAREALERDLIISALEYGAQYCEKQRDGWAKEAMRKDAMPEARASEKAFDDRASAMYCLRDKLRKALATPTPSSAGLIEAAEAPEFWRDFQRDGIERAAKVIYDLYPYDGAGQKPEWVKGGNSLKQDEARRTARLIVEAYLNRALAADRSAT